MSFHHPLAHRLVFETKYTTNPNHSYFIFQMCQFIIFILTTLFIHHCYKLKPHLFHRLVPNRPA